MNVTPEAAQQLLDDYMGPMQLAISPRHRHNGAVRILAAAPSLAKTVVDQGAQIERLNSYIDSLRDYVAPGVADNYASRILRPGDLGEES